MDVDGPKVESNATHCGSFAIDTDSMVAKCRCENVTWRMNVALITHDFTPHGWHPLTIAESALRGLFVQERFYQNPGAVRLIRKLEAEFESNPLFFSIMEV